MSLLTPQATRGSTAGGEQGGVERVDGEGGKGGVYQVSNTEANELTGISPPSLFSYFSLSSQRTPP